MNMDIKAQRMPGATEEQTSLFCYPIEYEYVPMFNTQSGFASYVIPAVLMLVIQQTMLVGIGLLAGNEREKKRKGILCAIKWAKTERDAFRKSLDIRFDLCHHECLSVLHRSKHVQSHPYLAIEGSACVYVPLPIGLCLFQHNNLRIVARPRSLYHHVYVHVGSFDVHFGHFLADLRCAEILARGVMVLPIHIRHQRICENQQHGGFGKRRQAGIDWLVGSGIFLRLYRLAGL